MSFGFTVGPLAVATIGCFLLYGYAGRARPSQALLIGGLLAVVSLACVTVAATTRASLLGANMMAILLTSVVLWRFSDAAAAMRRRIQLHTWQLRQLVPEATHRG